MKRKCWMFAMLLALLPFGQACQHAERDEPPAPARPAQPGAGGPQLSQEPYLTLAQVEADPYTTLVAVPGGYSPSMNGIWNYQEVFLLIGAVQGDTAEVYVFADESEYILADCDFKWVATTNKAGEITSATCDAPGSNCTVTSTCLIKCLDS